MADKKEFIWSELVHLGSNFWNEEGNTKGREHRSTPAASPELLFHRESWDKHIQDLKDAGVNTLIVDIGDAMLYNSHPEIALKGSWTTEQMRAEIDRLTGMGFELIPKLNFSACHDVWLKDYSRMLSTPVYYDVCRDLIREVCEVFKPRHFHLGMDEETYDHQRNFRYAVVRNGDLWWDDFYYLVNCVEKYDARPWIWSDYAWNHRELFLERMPKEVVQNNWYYSNLFGPEDEGFSDWQLNRLSLFQCLDEHGFDQVPTGSTFSHKDNFEKLTKYCVENLSSDRLLGMMQSTWERIDPAWMHVQDLSVETIRRAKQWYDINNSKK
jgi:hypothetical protein